MRPLSLLIECRGSESGPITNELIDYYDISPDAPTASAFVQQRDKLKPEAFETVFKGFAKRLCSDGSNDFPMSAFDGFLYKVA